MREHIKNKGVLPSIGVLALGVALGAYSLISFYTARVKTEWIMSPYLFPLLLSVFTVLLSVSLFFESKKKPSETKTDSADVADVASKESLQTEEEAQTNAVSEARADSKQRSKFDKLEANPMFMVIGVICSCIAYLFLMQLITFIPATILLLAFLIWLMGERRIHVIVLVSIVTPGVLYVLFSILLNVRLP